MDYFAWAEMFSRICKVNVNKFQKIDAFNYGSITRNAMMIVKVKCNKSDLT